MSWMILRPTWAWLKQQANSVVYIAVMFSRPRLSAVCWQFFSPLDFGSPFRACQAWQGDVEEGRGAMCHIFLALLTFQLSHQFMSCCSQQVAELESQWDCSALSVERLRPYGSTCGSNVLSRPHNNISVLGLSRIWLEWSMHSHGPGTAATFPPGKKRHPPLLLPNTDLGLLRSKKCYQFLQ